MIQIRYADYSDYSFILKIDSSITENKWKNWTDNKQVMITFINGEFAGWLQYSFFIEKIPFVNRLYVFEEYQHNSLGTGLMKFWEFEMVERGYTQLMLSTEKTNTAQEFYKKLGFSEFGSFDYFGEHTELMLGKIVDLTKSCCCCNKK